tara:strand:+ start:896 stop:2083 length:1188 start_codon:yes stop_codon:yes gene_type:complete
MIKNKKSLKNSISNELVKRLQKVCGNKRRPLHEPLFEGNEKEELIKCINSTYVSSKSIITKNFEKKISKYTKCKDTIAVINGTSALQISLLVVGLKKDEEVLMPSFNFVAAANAINYCGGIPNFLDIEESTLSIDPIKLKKYLNKNFIIKNKCCFNKKTKRKVRAIIVPHLFGHAAKIDEIVKIAKNKKLMLIEDAAESLGSFFKNKHTGTFGDLGILSFNGNKTITTGGGGAILSKKKNLTKKIRNLIDLSKKEHLWKFDYSKVGYNMKMPGINAALGCAQILNLEKIIRLKRKIFIKYKNQFNNSEYFDLVKEPKNNRSNYWLQNIKLKKNIKKFKNHLIEITNKKGYQTRPAWKLLHQLNHFKKCPKDDLKVSIDLFDRIISIPSSPNLIKK